MWIFVTIFTANKLHTTSIILLAYLLLNKVFGSSTTIVNVLDRKNRPFSPSYQNTCNSLCLMKWVNFITQSERKYHHNRRNFQHLCIIHGPSKAGVLPNSIRFNFGNSFRQSIRAGMLPQSWQKLDFGLGFNNPMKAGASPGSLQQKRTLIVI